MKKIYVSAVLILFLTPAWYVPLRAGDIRLAYPEVPLVGSEPPPSLPGAVAEIEHPPAQGGNIPVGTIVDSTIMDHQANATIHSRIVAVGDSALHATAMVSPDYGFIQRGMKYIYYAGGVFTNLGYIEGNGLGDQRGGYGSIVGYDHPSTGLGNVAVASSHTNIDGRTFGMHWYAFQDAFQGVGAFSPYEGWYGDGVDLCDELLWPSLYVTNDPTGHMAMCGITNTSICAGGFDDIQVVHKDFSDPVWSDPTLLHTLDDPSQWTNGPNLPMLAGSDDGRMAVVSSDYGTNVYYWQSTDAGVTWGERISLTGYPIVPHRVPPDTSSTEYRPLQNNAIAMSPEGIPHVVWTAYQARGNPDDSLYTPGVDPLYQYRTKLEHWDPVHGVTTVYQNPVGLSDIAYGTAFAYNVGHPSIGFGETGEIVYAVYEGFVDSDQDPSNDRYFGDIYVSVSTDGGATWEPRVNVTDSPGSDDLYPAIARINPQGVVQELPGFQVGAADGVNDFLMIYQNDDVAGTYMRGDEPQANWDKILIAPVDLAPITTSEFILSGPDPGIAGMDNTFDVSGAWAGMRVDFLYGTRSGSSSYPYCPDTVIDIDQARSGGYAVADGDGNATLTIFIPEGVAGRTLLFQAYEKITCRVSNRVEHTF